MSPRHFRRRELLALAVLALALRLGGLGISSMWFDEVLQTLQTRGTLAEAWSQLQGDVHPPLDAVISWAVQRVTTAEPLRRLVPVMWGVLTVVLLAQWAARGWGRGVGWAVGVLAACAPYHVRFSQELRPYSLAMLLVVATLVAADLLIEMWSSRRLAALALLSTAALATLYLDGLLALPVGVLWLAALREAPPRAENARRLLRASPWLLLGPALLGLVWWVSLRGVFERAAGVKAVAWSAERIAERWQFVTVGGREEEPASLIALLGAVLVVAGAVAALRARSPGRARGWAVFVALVGGTLATEGVLRATDHWSNGRYSYFAWPFVVIAMALGAAALAQGVTRRWPAWRAGVMATLVVAQLACQLPGLCRYYSNGRDDWRPVAASLAAWGPAARPVVAANDWTRTLLHHYLEPYPNGRFHIENLDGETWRLVALPWSGRRVGRCAVLVVGGWPPLKRIHRFAPGARLVAEFPRSDVRIFQLPAGPDGPPCPELAGPL